MDRGEPKGGAMTFGDTVVATLIGALAGGLMATAGAFLANRHELTRSHRVQMYLDLMPMVLDQLRGMGVQVALEQADELVRRATIASGRDRRRATAMRDQVATAESVRQAGFVPDGAGAQRMTAEGRIAFEEALGIAVAAAASYESWLSKRF